MKVNIIVDQMTHYQYKCELQDTIHKLKSDVLCKLGPLYSNYQYISNGKYELEDDKTLDFYHIKYDTTLHLVQHKPERLVETFEEYDPKQPHLGTRLVSHGI